MDSRFIFAVFMVFLAEAQSFRISSEEWDHLMFVQQWPQSECMLESRHQCVIPEYVDRWVIHGIWPSQGKTRGPNYCDRSWKFDESKVMDLEKGLIKYWPNLFDDTPKISFWKHEWEKHGTCAAALEALGDEHKYFSNGLVFIQEMEMLGALNKSGIVPSREGYQLSDITDQLQKVFGVQVCVECRYSRDIGQLLTQAVICLDKRLKIIDCPICEDQCSSDEKVLYPPIEHNQV